MMAPTVPPSSHTAYFRPAFDAVAHALTPHIKGCVASVKGLTILVDDLPVEVGTLVQIHTNSAPLLGEVVSLSNGQAMVFVLGQTSGVRAGSPVHALESTQSAPVGPHLLGRVIDGLGKPIDGGRPLGVMAKYPLSPDPLPALARARVKQQLLTGVRVIDLMTPLGKGQRLGLFAGPGVGKSTLLGDIARNASSDINVIALIGERGREVKDFIEHSLGPQGLARSIVVVATGDEPPLMRIRAAKLACSIAEYFRDRSLDVLLMMDSVTRFAHAQRLVGLASGEPPTTKGYTPSVFASLALLLERAGVLANTNPTESGTAGSITGLYTVLVEGDDMTEPVADAARGILDGHVILSRKIAQRGQFPAVDVLDSVSRVADDITDQRSATSRRQLVKLLAAYRDVEDLIQIGAFAKGANPTADVAVELYPQITALLRQARGETPDHPRAQQRFLALADESASVIDRLTKSAPRPQR